MTITTKDFANELIRYANLAVDNGELGADESARLLTLASGLITNNADERYRVKYEAALIRSNRAPEHTEDMTENRWRDDEWKLLCDSWIG